MKTQVSSFLLLALVTILVKAQTSSQVSYEDIIVGLFTERDAEGHTFHPLFEELQVDTLSPKGLDGSDVLMKSLRFLAQETMCNATQEQQGKLCPLKQKGELLLCSLVVSHPVQDISNIITSEMACEQLEPEDALKQNIRTRRSKSRKGSKGGKGWKGGSRPGGGSTIGSTRGGNKGNTQTA